MAELQQEIVKLDLLHPNTYNPNKMDERTYRAEVESIASFGFVDPITVRPHPEHDGHYEIIDGEHRKRAAEELEIDTVPVVILNLDTPAAKKLTIVMNETRGEADTVALGTLLVDLQASMGDDFRTALRWDDSELKHLLEVGGTDWSQFGDPPAPDGNGGGNDDDEWFTITARLPASVRAVWDKVVEEIEGREEVDLHDDPKVRQGQVIEILAASYLSIPT